MVLEVTATPILVVMGVAGTGKSTVAGLLAGAAQLGTAGGR